MADKPLCSIPDCVKPVKARGWCGAHLAKWRKYGDPLRVVKVTVISRCVAEGCDRDGTSSRKGMCAAHYKRLWRHGDPLAGSTFRAEVGEPLAWLKRHVEYEGDDCLTWPYASDRTNQYYGKVLDEDGANRGAHWVMCRLANGSPPSPDHQALHGCGNGHIGCVHPRHLRWGTQLENMRDRVRDGTDCRGDKSPMAKVTSDQVAQIRALRGKMRQADIGKTFGISQAHVSKIQLGGCRQYD